MSGFLPYVDERTAVALRRRLAEQLRSQGDVRTAPWSDAIAAVPRHEFVSAFWIGVDEEEWGTLWEPCSPRDSPRRWLDLVYSDRSLVTQLAPGASAAGTRAGLLAGEPTSSSTMPGLVARMWEDLDVDDGSRVLEIGTGTGYSTALGVHRLGDGQVTSVEVDPEVAAGARAALARLGYHPTLVVGDGLVGHAAGAPYDRLISTCAVRRVPAAWVAQVRPGGLILTTIWGWLWGSGIAVLTVRDDGTAEGRFLAGDTAFMPARAHAAPSIGREDLLVGPDAHERPTALDPEVLTTGLGPFLVQIAAPAAQHQAVVYPDDGSRIDYLVDVGAGACAEITWSRGGYHVRQSGPVHLWDAVEEAVLEWRRCGEPGIEHFTVRVAGDTQTIRLDRPWACLVGTLAQ